MARVKDVASAASYAEGWYDAQADTVYQAWCSGKHEIAEYLAGEYGEDLEELLTRAQALWERNIGD